MDYSTISHSISLSRTDILDDGGIVLCVPNSAIEPRVANTPQAWLVPEGNFKYFPRRM